MIEDGALKGDFQVELLGVYPLDECLEKEKKLAKTSLFPKGLNGNAGIFIVQTDEINERKRQAILGRKHTEQTKQKLSQIGKEKSRTDEFRRKVSEFHKGRKRSEETCLKIGDSQRGKQISDETKIKMTNAKKGKSRPKHSLETIEKIRQGNTGKRVSEETKQKIRDNQKPNLFFASEEGKQMARERNAKLIEEGRHPSQIHQICPHCQKSLPKSAIARWHGERCKMFSREGKE